jgi:RNA polymerase sigma-70 factor (ECF subfamily)
MSPTSGRASSGEITRLLHEASAGNKVAFDQLVPLVYDELHRIASNRIRVEPVGHTLTPTALVHEAYLALVVQDRAQWHSRSHFFAVAAQAMRRILINYAKMKERLKRGGGDIAIDLDAAESMGATAIPFSDHQTEDLLTLDAALDELRSFNPEGAAIVEYRFFGGLQFREIAEVSGVSEVTVRRRWTTARAWLRRALGADNSFSEAVAMGADDVG